VADVLELVGFYSYCPVKTLGELEPEAMLEPDGTEDSEGVILEGFVRVEWGSQDSLLEIRKSGS
jgi:hypothetical protein